MIYKERMATMAEARQNFTVYRVVRLLHDLKAIDDAELIRHEEFIYSTKAIGIDIDWYRYRIQEPNGNYIQF